MSLSFSNKVREEIYYVINDSNKKFACLYGMLLYCKSFSQNSLVFQTESRISASLFIELIDSVFKGQIVVKFRDNSNLLTCIIDSEKHIKLITDRYNIICDDRKICENWITSCNIGLLTGGIFLVCGSVNDPEKDYHLEFSTPNITLAEQLRQILSAVGVKTKCFTRKNSIVVYIKDSESIEDTLTFIGAQACTLELMDTKITKELRNQVNRSTNCYSANLDKVMNAAVKQTEDIRLIERVKGLECLDDSLRELAELRLLYPVASLNELGEKLRISISRSGINHRFKRLSKIAEELRRGNIE